MVEIKILLRKFKNNAYFLALTILAVFLMILFLTNSEIGINGIKKSLFFSADVLIPSLFPFMVLASLVSSPKILKIISLPFGFILKRIFRIKSEITSIFILSIIGGYPIGACLLADNVKNGLMDKNTAEKMLCYCTGAGPGFVISYLGFKICGSFEIGIIILISQILSNLILGFFFSFGLNQSCQSRQSCQSCRLNKLKTNSNETSIVSAITVSCLSMIYIIGFTLFFSAISEYLNLIPLLKNSPDIRGFIASFLEICGGISIYSQSSIIGIALPVILCFLTAIGGLSVAFQIKVISSKSGISIKKYLVSRIFHSCLSSTICYIILKITINSFSINEANEVVEAIGRWKNYDNNPIFVENFSVIPLISVILLSMCVLLILSIKSTNPKHEKTKK